DLAGIHLLDEETGTYNTPFLDESLELIPGYLRQQGILFQADDARLAGRNLQQAREVIAADHQLRMVNRNQGSGTRILIDQLLAGTRPDGYAVQPRSHNAVAAAIVRGSADWGVAIEQVATANMLGFIPLAEEHYDFICPAGRRSREAVELICQLLQDADIRGQLAALGLQAK
ncbi:MAG: substrate-binding domain-containing protein, partial [Planctomycetota bacterium]|nr:substrate-binding domain-containing protein [Planctomycetota bacterium]